LKGSIKVADSKKTMYILSDLNSAKSIATSKDVKLVVDFLIESGGFAFNSDREFWFGELDEVKNHLRSLPEGQTGEIINLSTLFFRDDEYDL
jgi:hypothetical protein